jgi:signal transduction histidine kinase/CheY-like chemotaxis protein
VADEETLLRSTALQNAKAILVARQRAEDDLMQAKRALEHKTTELAESLAMVRATLESTADALLATDGARRVTATNANLASMWELPPELTAPSDDRAVHAHISGRFAEPAEYVTRVESIYATSPPESFDVLETDDGRVIERFSKLQTIGGRTVGRVWSFRDITERRQAALALEEETRVLDVLHRTASMLVSQLDLQALLQALTDATTQVSGAAFGAFFYTAHAPEGGTFLLYTLAGAPREAFERFGHPRATPLFGPTFAGEGVIRLDDVLEDPRYGKWGPHHGMPAGHLPVRSYLAVPVSLRSGEIVGGLFFGHPRTGVFTARTERIVVGIAAQAGVAIENARLFESERAARAQAERTSRLKDEFLATLSHELRTPMNAIVGWANLLQREDADPAMLRRGLSSIAKNAWSQTRLIEDLLDMSRITSGQMRLDVQTVWPVGSIEAALESVRPSAESKGVRLEATLDPSAGPLAADPSRMQQVMWNLLSNAVKFTPRGGKIHVVLARVSSHVEITVSDTGVGIAPEFLPHAFDRFRQADGTSTRAHGGLGIGLAIVKNLIELHGGTVHATSAGPGHGATFAVHLPVAAVHPVGRGVDRAHPATGTTSPGEIDATELEGLKVLALDDDEDARELVHRVLASSGATVLTAADAAEALSLLERERPDVLVTDIGMPGVDGYELIRQVRARPRERGGHTPAIALTAFARPEDRTRVLRAGYAVHVAKPVDAAELVATVASVARRFGESRTV